MEHRRPGATGEKKCWGGGESRMGMKEEGRELGERGYEVWPMVWTVHVFAEKFF